MWISCDCGAFKAELTRFPANTPGRLMCYCDDCQSFLEKLGRPELLDAYGGTEVIPVYPSEIRLVQGQEHLVCNVLTDKGLFRWSTSCCNSPIGNTRANFPWLGLFHSAFRAADPAWPEKLGPVRSRIFGRYAKGQPPFPISDKIGVKEALSVMPFLIKGKIGGKSRPSPFFEADLVTPIVPPQVL